MKICSFKNCKAEGTFPAPKDPRNIGERQYFCAEHIKEFNKKWNGLAGMSDDEIFAMQQKATWDRPTWKFGTGSESFNKAQATFKDAEALYRFFMNRQKEQVRGGFHADQDNTQQLPPDVTEACVIFNIEPPFDAKKLKAKYLSLMKKHHPDRNRGDEKAEEMVKKINVAYQILKDYCSE